ncbi:MAG: hypothetical protein R3B70_02980 [Polyangiaceae bacterium]
MASSRHRQQQIAGLSARHQRRFNNNSGSKVTVYVYGGDKDDPAGALGQPNFDIEDRCGVTKTVTEGWGAYRLRAKSATLTSKDIYMRVASLVLYEDAAGNFLFHANPEPITIDISNGKPKQVSIHYFPYFPNGTNKATVQLYDVNSNGTPEKPNPNILDAPVSNDEQKIEITGTWYVWPNVKAEAPAGTYVFVPVGGAMLLDAGTLKGCIKVVK